MTIYSAFLASLELAMTTHTILGNGNKGQIHVKSPFLLALNSDVMSRVSAAIM